MTALDRMAATALSLPAPGVPAPAAPPRRRLEAVPRPRVRRAPRVAHGIVALSGLGVILLAQLGLSIASAESAYDVADLQAETSALDERQQQLQEQLETLQAPQSLAVAAEGLGMVPGQSSRFLQLSTGAVLGGPDALHMQQSGTSGGVAIVGNELLVPDAPVEAAPTEPVEPTPYPGMLLDPEGVPASTGD